MINQVQDFISEQMQAFTSQAQQFGSDPLASVRDGVSYSVEGLNGLKQPVRVAARSGVELSALTQKTFEEAIELQSDMLTSALNEIAATLEHASRAKDLAGLMNGQAEALRASAERLVTDANRAMEIYARAGRGVQKIATETYEKVAKQAEAAPRATKPRSRKAA